MSVHRNRNDFTNAKCVHLEMFIAFTSLSNFSIFVELILLFTLIYNKKATILFPLHTQAQIPFIHQAM